MTRVSSSCSPLRSDQPELERGLRRDHPRAAARRPARARTVEPALMPAAPVR